MNRLILTLAPAAVLGSSACERQPTVVAVPAAPAEAGKSSPGTTVIVEPSPPPKRN